MGVWFKYSIKKEELMKVITINAAKDGEMVLEAKILTTSPMSDEEANEDAEKLLEFVKHLPYHTVEKFKKLFKKYLTLCDEEF